MKIEFIKVKFGNEYVFKYKPIKYCCGELEYDEDIILTDEDIVNVIDIGDHHIPQMCIHSSKTMSEWEDEWEEIINKAISFCPYCGEKIKVEVVEECDMTEKFTEIITKRDELNVRRRATDSKKEEQKLSNEVRKLDKQIDWFYEIGEYEA